MSKALRDRTLAQRETYIQSSSHNTVRPMILQTQLTEEFPATFFLHGQDDKFVLPSESLVTYDRLKELGAHG